FPVRLRPPTDEAHCSGVAGLGTVYAGAILGDASHGLRPGGIAAPGSGPCGGGLCAPEAGQPDRAERAPQTGTTEAAKAQTATGKRDRKSTRLNSSHVKSSYAV